MQALLFTVASRFAARKLATLDVSQPVQVSVVRVPAPVPLPPLLPHVKNVGLKKPSWNRVEGESGWESWRSID